jgi:hypothetical protein
MTLILCINIYPRYTACSTYLSTSRGIITQTTQTERRPTSLVASKVEVASKFIIIKVPRSPCKRKHHIYTHNSVTVVIVSSYTVSIGTIGNTRLIVNCWFFRMGTRNQTHSSSLISMTYIVHEILSVS